MAKWEIAASAVTFGRVDQEPIQRLKDAGCTVHLNPLGRPLSKTEIVDFAKNADALILGNDQLPASAIRRLKKLKIIARYGVGFDRSILLRRVLETFPLPMLLLPIVKRRLILPLG